MATVAYHYLTDLCNHLSQQFEYALLQLLRNIKQVVLTHFHIFQINSFFDFSILQLN